MSWSTPTAADVLASLPEDERDLYAGLGDDDEDTLAQILADVVLMIRGRIAACARSVLDPDATTLPPECRDPLLAIVRHRLLARLDAESPGETDRRSQEYRDALRYLESIARCEVIVTPGTTASGSSVALINSQTRITGRDKLSGL